MGAPRIHVLIVGSHPAILGLLRLACQDVPSAEVAGEAASGLDALQLAARLHPDAILLDLDLADSDGLEVLRAIRAGGYSGRTLVLSERGDGSAVLEAMRLGVEGFLTKADGLRHVGDAVRCVLEGRRAIEPLLEQAAVLELGRRAKQAREGSRVEATLTPREREILRLLAEGLTMQQIGRRIGISPRTVETHTAKLYRKLDVRTRIQAVGKAASLGLITFG